MLFAVILPQPLTTNLHLILNSIKIFANSAQQFFQTVLISWTKTKAAMDIESNLERLFL